MTGHMWGDDWAHWDELYEAQNYIVKRVRQLSKCRLSCKEKYGTIRYEWLYPPGGYHYVRWELKLPFIMKTTPYGKCPYILWRWCDSWAYRQWVKLGNWSLRKAIKEAMLKFPNVKEEIYDDWIFTEGAI